VRRSRLKGSQVLIDSEFVCVLLNTARCKRPGMPWHAGLPLEPTLACLPLMQGLNQEGAHVAKANTQCCHHAQFFLATRLLDNSYHRLYLLVRLQRPASTQPRFIRAFRRPGLL
jgi:hypothetical protein